MEMSTKVLGVLAVAVVGLGIAFRPHADSSGNATDRQSGQGISEARIIQNSNFDSVNQVATPKQTSVKKHKPAQAASRSDSKHPDPEEPAQDEAASADSAPPVDAGDTGSQGDTDSSAPQQSSAQSNLQDSAG